MVRVVDLFAGLGGFSAGAIEAGGEVILGVDSDPVPLKLWSANVPGGTARLATLGNGGDQIELPPPAPDLHVHLSSPCTDLSCARGASATPDDIARGVSMLRWCLDLVLERGDYSWSIENVSTITTRETLTDYAMRFPARVAYASIDAADYGACQTRMRLIAGPPGLIKKLQEMPSSRRVSVREAFTTVGLQPPSTNFKNQTRSRAGGPCMRSVEEQAFTVCASHGLTWCNASGQTTRVMTARESAVLMGFPMTWRLPPGSRAAQRAVGNALCVAQSKAIVQAAISIHTDTPIPTPLQDGPHLPQSAERQVPPPVAEPRPLLVPSNPPASENTLQRDVRRLRKRIRTLESMVSNLQTALQLSMSRTVTTRPDSQPSSASSVA
jgi:site-specific DNA-cytosine methylase